MVPKARRRDWSHPRSYRLIALLPILAKRLERPLAKSLIFEGVHYAVVRSGYLCAVPRRATADLLLSLMDEIELADKRQKNVAIFVTFDVQGAFDAVGLRRLVKRLIEQFWSTKVCHWVSPFLENGMASTAFNGVIGRTGRLILFIMSSGDSASGPIGESRDCTLVCNRPTTRLGRYSF